MPGARTSIKPLSAGGPCGSSFDDVSQLELHLQKQLEEDVARIFDESIYCDLEVVSGKLKILTHSCILKARTHKFFHKLEAILHVNIGRNTFDEIYSFISDAYTECDIQHQENEIIHYLKDKLNLKTESNGFLQNKQEDFDESDAYATPDCLSPDESSHHKTISSSPSTELTKEYYALVPLESQILDRELVEQDELSSGFKSFINLRKENQHDDKITQCIKPTTLSLNSSHISKRNKHSIICDTSKDSEDIVSNSFLLDNGKNIITNSTSQVRKHVPDINKNTQSLRKCLSVESAAAESAYSPDSLIADEPSSSSDYQSTALSASPGGAHAPLANMNNALTTVSDSGIDNNVMLESLNSHKDVTLADVSLSESTLHEFLNDETSPGQNSSVDATEKKQTKSKLDTQISLPGSYKPGFVEMSGRSSKDEKQKQNEEIVILESSSLSSETGSWESVFPPKLPDKILCEKFIDIERQNSIESGFRPSSNMNQSTSLSTENTQIPSNKSASCFIDASSLADEEERQHEEYKPFTFNNDIVFRTSSRPVPCESKQDIVSPIDYSESNDNDDSLEQPDPDSIQKDISPTIFEMTLAVEDSLAENDEENHEPEQIRSYGNVSISATNLAKSTIAQAVAMTSTPNNSIISLNTSDYKTYDSESSDNDAVSYKKGSSSSVNMLEKIAEKPNSSRSHAIRQDIFSDDLNKKYNESSPIMSGGASIEDHLPKIGQNGSPMAKRKIENIPILSGAYIPPQEHMSEKTYKSPINAAAWVVDMSKSAKSEDAKLNRSNKPGDKTCDSLRALSKSTSNSDGCKSRSSVDSDSSERSTHKFYIDLSTLPDALAPEQTSAMEKNEKKNIFSMFIDLGENSSTVKEMPARLSSSLNTKKTSKVETKPVLSKTNKAVKKSSNSTNGNDDNVFEKLESLCDSPQLSISEILQQIQTKNITKEQKEEETSELKEYHRPHPRDGIAQTIKEEPDLDQSGEIFVRLSDLDRAPLQKESEAESAPRAECFERMTRSIPDNNWAESSHTSSRSIDIISSFHSENALSLNRLFPHLKNDLSRSMPGSLSGRTRSPFRLAVSASPGDREELVSDVSELSSVQSSMCRSVVENSTTEDTSHTSSLLINCQSRLGQDLLRMFMEEIAPDVVVEVSGRRIKAHKCILSSRCQYFAGILSGGWVESAGNVISLPPFSFSVVHFALCHIYSGISTIPDSISIVELATIADMLGLEGLKEAIMFTLKAKYCHHFHEPCQVCTAGVLECFPLSSVYGLDDLYRRCLRWITKHFRKVWPTKAFATLPSELLDKCYQELLLNLTVENLADTVYDCGYTVASLHRCRWAEVVARLCRRLMSAAGVFAGSRLSSVVRATCQRGTGGAGGCALDECLAAAAASAPPDELCRALVLLHAVQEARARPPPDLLAESAPTADRHAALRRRCEEALLRMAPRALRAPAFPDLPHELRRRLRDAARRHPDPTTQRAPPAAAPAPQRRRPRRRSPPPIDRVRASFVPYSPRPQPAPEPQRPVPPPNPPRVRTTKAQEERAKFNMSKSTEKSQEKVNGKAGCSRPRAAYEHTKPRYLEPRAGAGAEGAARRLISSSESSRNSSPVLPRAPRAARDPRPPAAPRLATADPSTDSLSDSLNTNKYATYTKSARRDPKPPTSAIGSLQSRTQTTSMQPAKVRGTKIPVYLNQSAVSGRRPQVPAAAAPVPGKEARGRHSAPAPRPRGSLMMATKSSSAKMVNKIVKEPCATAKSARTEAPRPRSPCPGDIPVMERSGTFLKDEPTFGDITTNIDIDN